MHREVNGTTEPDLLLNPVAFSAAHCGAQCRLPRRNGVILANRERQFSRVENLLLMLDWAAAGSLIALDSRGFGVLESFAKRAFASILD